MSSRRILILFSILIVCGCNPTTPSGGDEKTWSERQKENVESRIELMSRIQNVTNLVHVQPVLARTRGGELRDWICRLEHFSLQINAIDIMERSILDIDMRSWAEAERERGVNAIFDLGMEVVNALAMIRASPTRIWQTRFNVLRRMQREMKYIEGDLLKDGISEIEKMRLGNAARFLSTNYQTWLKMFEYDFVVNDAQRLPVDELESIQKMFEKTIGRPLKTVADFSHDVRREN